MSFEPPEYIGLGSEYKFTFPGGKDFFHSDDDENLSPQMIVSTIRGFREILGFDEMGVDAQSVSMKVSGSKIAVNIDRIRNCHVDVTA